MPSRTLETWPHGAIMQDAQHTRFALWAPDAFYVSVELQGGAVGAHAAPGSRLVCG